MLGRKENYFKRVRISAKSFNATQPVLRSLIQKGARFKCATTIFKVLSHATNANEILFPSLAFLLFYYYLCTAAASEAAGERHKKAFTRWLMFHENKLLSIYFSKTSTAKLNAALKALLTKDDRFAVAWQHQQQSNDILLCH